MVCKNCGKILPFNNRICPYCKGFSDTTIIQKPIQMASEKYGNKKQIYEKREDKKNKVYGLLFLFVLITIIFFIAIFVYLS